MCQYLDNVTSGRIPVANHTILYQIQDMLNLRPDLDVSELITAFNIKSNDQMMVYVSTNHPLLSPIPSLSLSPSLLLPHLIGCCWSYR
jgi:hypothetical protein